MHAPATLAALFLLGGCHATATAVRETRSEVEPHAAAASSLSPRARLPAPTADSVTLHRTRCYGNCSAYDVTVYASGLVAWHGEAHVTRIGAATRAIEPELAKSLIARAGGFDAKAFDNPACGGDAGAMGVTVRHGDVERTLWVGGLLLLETCDDNGRCAPQKPPPGLADSIAEIRRLAAFGDEIDRAAATQAWIDDPECRELPSERVGSRWAGGGDADVDAMARRSDEEHYEAIERRLARERDAVVRIAANMGAGARARMDGQRRALIERGIAPERIVLEDLEADVRLGAAVALTVGPRRCFLAAR